MSKDNAALARLINDHLRKQADERMLGAIYGGASGQVTTTANSPVGSLTIDSLRRMMLAMPAREMWLSSLLFSNDAAIRFSAPKVNYTLAGPAFWARLQNTLRQSANFKPIENPFLPPSCMGVSITDIDEDEYDAPHRAKWKRNVWRELIEAMRVACVDLPDWLQRKGQDHV